MSILLDPNNPYGVAPTVNRQFFPGRARPYNNITPFTYRDGETYLEIQTELRNWLSDQLVPFIDETIEFYVDEFNKNIAKLTEYAAEFQEYISSEKAYFDGKIDEYQQLVDKATTDFIKLSTEAIDAATKEADRAKTARDEAEVFSATMVRLQDQAVAQLLTSGALTTASLRPAVITAMDEFIAPAIATITPYTAVDQFGNTYEYEVIRVKAKGQNINRVVEKTYNGFEKRYNPGNSFYPPQFFLSDVVKGVGAYVGTNADAVQGTTLPSARVTGVQIKDGVLYAGWGSYNDADPRLGNETLAFMRDGSWKLYRRSETPDPATIVADGAHTTYGFGPIVVENGAIRNMETDFWQDWVTQVSARTAIGRDANGDVLIGLVKGKTGSAGIRGNELGRLMLRHGAADAIMLDGGGSTQGYANGRYFHPSSDTAGQRASSNMILIHTPDNGDIHLLNEPVTLESGWIQATGNGQPFVSKDGGIVTFLGTALNEAVQQNTWYTIATISERFRPPVGRDVRGTGYANGGVTANRNNGQFQYSLSGTTGILQIKFTGDGGIGPVQGWADLSAITYKAGY